MSEVHETIVKDKMLGLDEFYNFVEVQVHKFKPGQKVRVTVEAIE